MRVPYHLFRIKAIRSEPLLAAMAAVAAGMFLGAWLIGPALTHKNSDIPGPAAHERMSYEEMLARPDPPPYRSPTPAFDASNAPDYAAAAKARAQAQVGDIPAPDDVTATASPRNWSSQPRRVPRFDRHTIY